jgi:hypothetical protein
MADLGVLLVILLFFALSAGLVRFCQRLME